MKQVDWVKVIAELQRRADGCFDLRDGCADNIGVTANSYNAAGLVLSSIAGALLKGLKE